MECKSSIIPFGSGYLSLNLNDPMVVHQNQSCTMLSAGMCRSRDFWGTSDLECKSSIIPFGSGYLSLNLNDPMVVHQNQSCTMLSAGMCRSRYLWATPSSSCWVLYLFLHCQKP